MTASEEEEAEQGRREEHGEQHEGVGREQGPEKGVVEQQEMVVVVEEQYWSDVGQQQAASPPSPPAAPQQQQNYRAAAIAPLANLIIPSARRPPRCQRKGH